MGSAILIAIIAQFMTSAQKAGFDPVNFLSFFTIQSNILAATLLLTLAASPMGQLLRPSTRYIRGAITLYMAVVGIVYVTLLANHPATLDTTLPWVNIILHYIAPLYVVMDWILQPPQTKLLFSRAVWWLVFPLLYLVYSLVRGHFTAWYPYPFLNVSLHGLGQVILTCVGIAIVVTGLTRLLLVFYSRSPKIKK
jgi:hypothetical protein